MKLAVIRIRGVNRVSHPMERTLQQLHLYRKNYCAVVPDTPAYRGMLAKVKDYVTYGLIDDAMHKQLLEKKGEEYVMQATGRKKMHKKYVEIDSKKYKPFFRLMPPRSGFEKKGTKKSYSVGGALGFRGEKIKTLIEKMI